jgi:hypothetical protein
MKLTDEERTEMSRAALAVAADVICKPDSNLSAILLVTDGEGLMIHPLRVSKEQAFSILVAACSALEPQDLKETQGEPAIDPRRLN